MLEDIEQIAHKYYEIKSAIILLFYWSEEHNYKQYVYDITAMKSAKAKQRKLLKKYGDDEAEQTKTKTKTSLSYYFSGDSHNICDDIYISIKIHIIHK